MAQRVYKTQLDQWRRELSAELHADITLKEIARETGISYAGVHKHATQTFIRPDYSIAARICDWFNANSNKVVRTPSDYFVLVESESTEGQPVGAATA